MSDNEARERDAREFQAENPGTSYTRARRQVARTRRPLRAVLGTGLNGQTVAVDLEWASRGGSGPHCAIVGSQADAVGPLMAILASGLMSGQHRGDLELLLCAGDGVQIGVEHRRFEAEALANHVDELLNARSHALQSLDIRDVEDARAQGHRLPTTVVLIEDLDGAWARSREAGRWVRIGRSLGVNIVVGISAQPPAGSLVDDLSPAHVLERLARAAGMGADVLNNMSATIFSLGERRGTLRTIGQWDPVRRRQAPDVLADFTFTALAAGQ